MPVFPSLIVFAPLSKIKLSIICVGLFLDSILPVLCQEHSAFIMVALQ